MTTHNLLVELFVEELPPKALRRLGESFAHVLASELKTQGLAPADTQATPYASPRRLAAHLTNVAVRGADKAERLKLMPVSVGLDAAGQATPALLKKLAALGLPAEIVPQLARAVDGKAEALFCDRTVAGASLHDALQKALLQAIAQLPIPKVMTYQLHHGTPLPGWDSVQFVRPVHGLLALHGAKVVPVQALGLTAGRITHGHRFEAMTDPIEIAHADQYAQALRTQGAVIAGFEERRADIQTQLQAVAAQTSTGLVPIEDEALLDEVTALVERPRVMACRFDAEYLQVPQECLILTMKANQKYFPLLDTQGRLSNRFLVVSNIDPADASAVIAGNERVVRPRLADARFFFEQDRKKTLESRLPQLAEVVYHGKLGTQGERSERVRAIARAIAAQLAPAGDTTLAQAADHAARLAKADLVSDMVGEFPELQGVMGRYYALHDGLPGEVADAIEDHYKPRFSGDALPRGLVGTVVALADKLETLVGMFGIGNLPTGERDPFALRRHALGVIRMVLEKKLPLDAGQALDAAAAAFGALLSDAASSNTQLMHFMHDRLNGYLREQGASSAEAEAVTSSKLPWHELPQALAAVRAFARLPQATALAAANKRIGNILKKSVNDSTTPVATALLRENAEQALHAAMGTVLPKARAEFDAGDFTASLKTLADLRAPVDRFFDDVMVNAEDPALRANRLALLRELHEAMNRVADLSRLAA